MSSKLIEGVYAALLTPRSKQGELDEPALLRHLAFLLANGIDGFVLNGATGEFCLTSLDELDRLAESVSVTLGSGRRFVCGIGSTSVQQSCHMADIAGRHGAAAVLLPPAYFFPYQQHDVVAFLSAVADRSPLPVLLYNLPLFTTPITSETALLLLKKHPNIIGLKDSSGSLDLLSALSAQEPAVCRIVGSDGALVEAREQGLCDAVISGVACIFPKLIRSIFDHADDYPLHCHNLAEILRRLDAFPTPWGLKWLAEARDLSLAHFAQSLAPSRLEQGRQLQQWLRLFSAT